MGCTVSTSKEKRSLLLIAISHIIIGIVSHQVLLNALSSLGFSAIYEQVIAFEKSAALSGSIDDLPPGLVQTDDGGDFCRRMADSCLYNDSRNGYHSLPNKIR